MPLHDIYGRTTPQFFGTWSAETALVTPAKLSRQGDVDLVSQSVTCICRQQVLNIHEVGTNYVYTLAGRASGDATMGRVLGPRDVLFAFYMSYANPCGARSNEVIFAAQHGGFGPSNVQRRNAVQLEGCVIQSVQFFTQAEMMSFSEATAMTFVALTHQKPKNAR